MWRVQYNNYDHPGEDFFSVYRMSEDYLTPAQQSSQYQLPVSRGHGASEFASDNSGFMIVDEILSDAENDTALSDHVEAREEIKVRQFSPSFGSILKPSPDVFKRHLESFDNGNARNNIQDSSKKDKKTADSKTSSYGNKRTIFLAVFVRVLLIGHNIVTAWRVTEAYDDNMYWLLVLTNLALILEGVVVLVRRGGIEYSWWCPCFLVYLASTIPSIWLLQLDQHDRFIASQRTAVTHAAAVSSSIDAVSTTASTPISSMSSVVVTFSTEATSAITTLISSSVSTSPSTSTISSTMSLALETFSTMAASLNTSVAGQTEAMTPNKSISVATGTTISSTTNDISGASDLFPSNITANTTVSVDDNTTAVPTSKAKGPSIGMPDNDIWVIIVNESLVYLIVFSRWLLPRGRVSRDFLADLLLEFLAIASDIMELLAVFDEDDVRRNLNLTYAILAVWSASFIQFIPILTQKKRFRKPRRPEGRCLMRFCGKKFLEFTVTCMSIFLQDLPFLVIRLYIIIEVNLITYSLIFFLLKNIVSMLLLFYRLVIICHSMPFCKRRRC